MELDISRPLFFLCGPAFKRINGKDSIEETKLKIKQEKKENRRSILQKHISKMKDGEFKPLPIIVDELFNNDEEIEKYKLNVDMLEEIVSNISAKTYIFLDTMATSYELGLFTNTKQSNNVSILLDSNYERRNNCNVSEYILKAVDKKYIIQYEAKYMYNYIYFKNNIIPKSIKDDIKNTCDYLKKYSKVKITFTDDISRTNEVGVIKYKFDNHSLSFLIDIKTIFYLLADEFYNKDYKFNNEINKDIKKRLCFLVTRLFLIDENISRNIKRSMILNKIIGYITNADYDIDSILDNICYIIYKMKHGHLTYNNSSIRSAYNSSFDKRETVMGLSYKEIFNLSDYDINIIKRYNQNQDDFIYKFNMNINGKVRKIITYKNNKNGVLLKQIHKKIVDSNIIYKPVSYAFAYVKKKNTLLCVQEHQDSKYFEKIDIKKFFENIDARILMNKIKSHTTKNINYYFAMLNRIYYIRNTNDKELRCIINSMTYKNKLTIGFVTSPMWSNFYMLDFDLAIKSLDYTYTRYADDILISSKRKISVDIDKTVNKELFKIGLSMNNDKRYSYVLDSKNKYLKFLGIVLLKTDNGIIFKLSQSYKKKIIKLINQYLYDRQEFLYDNIKGNISYIKMIDDNLYESIIKLYRLRKIDIIKIFDL